MTSLKIIYCFGGHLLNCLMYRALGIKKKLGGDTCPKEGCDIDMTHKGHYYSVCRAVHGMERWESRRDVHSAPCRSHCSHPVDSWLACRHVQRHGGEHYIWSQKSLGREGGLEVRNNAYQKAWLGVCQQRVKPERSRLGSAK